MENASETDATTDRLKGLLREAVEETELVAE